MAKPRDGGLYHLLFGSSNDVTSPTVQEFTDAQIDMLEDYLEDDDTPDDIPLFILSHYPCIMTGTLSLKTRRMSSTS
jgi:hypothetical protein